MRCMAAAAAERARAGKAKQGQGDERTGAPGLNLLKSRGVALSIFFRPSSPTLCARDAT
jgi:hypothetical protein